MGTDGQISCAATGALRSPIFYWEFVIIQVEEHLYKVPKHVLEESSEVFASMFSLPQPDSNVTEGLSDERPIKLEGIEKGRFDALLTALLIDTRHVSYSDAGLGQLQWLWVLELANMWHMAKMRTLAISQLSIMKMSDVDRIVYGQKFAVVDWVVSGYKDIASRTIVISPEDADRLGTELCLRIWQIQLRTAGNMKYSASFMSLLKQQLTEAFAAVLNDAYQRALNLGDAPREQPPSFS